MSNENLTIKDWQEYVKPDHVIINLSNGKDLKISKQHIKGGMRAYQIVLTLLDNMSRDKRAENAMLQIVNTMSNNLSK
jgi:glycerol-3-phosphate O-acyltransferase